MPETATLLCILWRDLGIVVQMVQDLEANCLGLNNFAQIIQVSVALLLSLSLSKMGMKRVPTHRILGFRLELNKKSS